jgi:hypothetical protein
MAETQNIYDRIKFLAPIAKVNKRFSFEYKGELFNVLHRTGKRKYTMVALNKMPFPSIVIDGHLDQQEIIPILEKNEDFDIWLEKSK